MNKQEISKGLRKLADWFDAEQDKGRSDWDCKDTEVQDDLRRWANEIEQKEKKG